MQRQLRYCLLLFLICFGKAWAQTPFSKQIISDYPEPASISPNSIIDLPGEDGYLVFGSTTSVFTRGLIHKLEQDGSYTWSKSLYLGEFHEFYHVKSVADGTGVTAVYNAVNPENLDSWIVLTRFDFNGEMLWMKSYTGVPYLAARDVAFTDDGILITGLFNEDFFNTLSKMLVMKVAFTGELQWSKAVDHENEVIGTNLLVDDDGSFYVAGHLGSFEVTESKYLLTRFSADGGMLWAKTYRSGVEWIFTASTVSLAKTSTGDIVLAGNQLIGGGDVINPEILKLSADGAVISNIFIVGASASGMKSAVIGDHIYMLGNALVSIAETSGSSPNPNLSQIVNGNVLTKFNLNLEEVWSKRMGIREQDFRPNCAIASDEAGNILTAFGTYSGNYEIPYLDFRSIDATTGGNLCDRIDYMKDRFILTDPITVTEPVFETADGALIETSVDLSELHEDVLTFETLSYCLEANTAPAIVTPIPDQAVNASENFTIDVSGVFQDTDEGDEMKMYAAEGDTWLSAYIPEWAIFDETTMTLSGHPHPGDVGTYNFFIVVYDFPGHRTIEEFKLEVVLANRAPYTLQSVDNKTMAAGKAFSYTFSASLFEDPDDDELAYSVTLADGSPLPSWLTFDNSTRTLSGSADDALIGNSYDLVLQASDSEYSAEIAFAVTVVENHAPSSFSLSAPANGSVIDEETEEISFIWDSSEDEDDDRITYTITIYDGTAVIKSFETFETSLTMPAEYLPINEEVQWQVEAFDGGLSSTSSSFTIMRERKVVTSVETNSEVRSFFYPNPANDKLRLNELAGKNATIVIRDLNGKELLRSIASEISVRDVPPGLYVIELHSAAKHQKAKLIITR